MKKRPPGNSNIIIVILKFPDRHADHSKKKNKKIKKQKQKRKQNGSRRATLIRSGQLGRIGMTPLRPIKWYEK